MNKIVIGIICLFLISATTFTKLTERSTQQIVLVNDNVQILKNNIESHYKQGYRVIDMESQSVSITDYVSSKVRYKGVIIVIMEK